MIGLKHDEVRSEIISLDDLAEQFPLSWSAYVRLLSVKRPQSRTFYESEACVPAGRFAGQPR